MDIADLVETDTMISFDIKANGSVVTRFLATWKRPETLDFVEHGVYGWSCWRPGPDDGPDPAHLDQYMCGEVVHLRADGIEILTLRILEDWDAQKTAKRYAESPAGQLDREFARRREHKVKVDKVTCDSEGINIEATVIADE